MVTAARSREALLENIVEIVKRTGLAGFSLDALAAELGTSSRMLVYYFGSKDELLGLIVFAHRAIIREQLDESPARGIMDAIDRWWAYYRANPADMQFFFHLASRSFEEPEKFRQFSSTAVDTWTTYFQKSLEGEVGGGEADVIAHLVLGTLRGLMVDYLVTGDDAHVSAALDEFKGLLGSHVLVAESLSSIDQDRRESNQ